jgi:cobalt-zinc-cadmium efflux system protein
VHDLHIWTVSTGFLALSVHLVSKRPEDVLEEANKLLEDKYGIHHTTIQVEHPDQFRSERCYDCLTRIKAG